MSLLGAFAEEAGDKEADKWGTAIFDRLRDKIDAAEQKNVPSAETTKPNATERDAPAATSGLPPIRLYTVAEADEAQKRLDRPLRPRRKRALPLALPVAEDGFFDNLTSRSAIINVRETIRDLVGPLEGEEENVFNRKWDAVIEYPAPNIVEWLKKVAPIASEMVRIKAFVDANVIEWSDVSDEANLARTFGAFEEAENLMAEANDIADAPDAAKARMAELQAKLEALGEMPDPIEEKAAARKRHKEAIATVKKAFGNKSEMPEEIAEYAGIYMTGRYALLGSPDIRMHVCDFAAGDTSIRGIKSARGAGSDGTTYAIPLWNADMISIEPVFCDEDTGMALFKFGYMDILDRPKGLKPRFLVDYAFGKSYGDEGLIFYLPEGGTRLPTMEEIERNEYFRAGQAVSIRLCDGGMCLRFHGQE